MLAAWNALLRAKAVRPDRRRARHRQVPAGRGVSRPARRDAALVDRMEFVAAVAEYAAASRPRLGTRPVRRSRGCAGAAAGRARIGSRAVKLDAAKHAPLLAPLVDIPVPPERLPSLSPEEIRRRQLAAMVDWALAGARASRLFSSLRICSGSTRRRSISCMRSAIAARRPPSSFWRRRGLNSGRPGAFEPHHSVISLAPLDEAQVQRMIAELASQRTLSAEVIKARERARRRRAVIRRGGDAADSRARRARRRAGDPADPAAVACGAPRPAGIGARSRADRRGVGAELLLCRFCATSPSRAGAGLEPAGTR